MKKFIPRIIAPGVFTLRCVLFGHKFLNLANWFYCERCCEQVSFGADVVDRGAIWDPEKI